MSKIETQIAKLTPQRVVAIKQIANIKQFLEEKGENARKEELGLRLGALETAFKNFLSAQGQLEILDPEELKSDTRYEIEEQYLVIKPQLQILIAKFKPACLENNNSLQPETNFVKLPKCEITPFDGDRKKWLSFYETFTKLIHNNTTLSDVARFGYLKQLILHPASQTIESLELTSKNYHEALKLLEQRFSNRKLICEDHIRAIFSLQIIEKPSAEKIRSLMDSVNSNLRALHSLNRPTEYWDDLVIYIICSKLDSETRYKWDEAAPPDHLASLDELMNFLNKRSQSLESSAQLSIKMNANHSSSTKTNNRKSSQNVRFAAPSVRASPCLFCKAEGHRIYNCHKFRKLPPMQRNTHAINSKLCINCLQCNHNLDSCSSKYKCNICSKQHHSLLHEALTQSNSHQAHTLHTIELPFVPPVNQTQSQCTPQFNSQKAPLASSQIHDFSSSTIEYKLNDQCIADSSQLPEFSRITSLHSSNSRSYVFLGTALIKVMDKNGKLIIGRALLDSCSQINFITSDFALKLGLKRRKSYSTINAVGSATTNATSKVDMQIFSCTSGFNAKIEAFILSKITDKHPAIEFNETDWNIPKNIHLADKTFAQPQNIDLLIGAELYLSLLSVGQIILRPDLPRLQNTVLGWIVSGAVTTVLTSNCSNQSFICNVSMQNHENELKGLLEKFWELETPMIDKPCFTSLEKQCEEHFHTHTRRDHSGRYVVALPFFESPSTLGNSRAIATRRFLCLENRLSKNAELRKAYRDFMIEYQNLNHMVPVPEEEIRELHYYMPHHCVVKQESSSTKLRVVFDASAKTTTGVSLNEIMMVGPVLQSDLFSILIRFRRHRFVISADVTKMYRQFLVRESDTHYQYILWRNNFKEELQTFRLLTVTYGTAAASYLATKCICALAKDFSSTYPISSQALHSDVYVDNLLTGADSTKIVNQIKVEISTILKSAGMELRKWCSNNETILDDIVQEDREPYVNIDDDKIVKTLGLLWMPTDDHFRFYVSDNNRKHNPTKRSISSEIARIFDPLGFTGPVIIIGKLILKRLWELKIDWDASIPQSLYSQWEKYKSELNLLNKIRIPRHIFANTSDALQMHGFADASEVGYGAAIYVRICDVNAGIQCHLLCAKSKIAPSKIVSLPRLELCAAELLAQLMKTVAKALNVSSSNFFYWTDSTIVLQWINSQSSHYKTFVANRVSQIQRLTKQSQWHHVSSTDNPADIISRGAYPSQLIHSHLWFYGPPFLIKTESNWPILSCSEVKDPVILECKTLKTVLLTSRKATEGGIDLLNRIKYKNNYRSIINVMSYVQRFVSNTKIKSHTSRNLSKGLTSEEREKGLNTIIRIVQCHEFSEEYDLLSRKKLVNTNSSLKSLSVFIDEEKVMRVGGRLIHCAISYSSKFPIVLPSTHWFTVVMLTFFHHKYMHAAPQALLAAVREQFWPLNGRKLAAKVFNNCITCTRVRPKIIVQTMGNLPLARASLAPPFYNVGIDFCGPFHVHYRIRGKTPTKAYLCVFICFTVKAIHLELVTEMTTAAFMGAFKRFISTRGLCKKIWTDNGLNFVGANNQLHDLYQLLMSEAHNDEIRQMCQNDAIEWNFSPPYSPHFGGLYEAAVKSAKYHLRRIVGNASLTFEELNTVVKQVESVLNSRPLTPISNNPNDLQVLTPGHFLIGRPLSSIPEPYAPDPRINLCKRWQLVQQLVNHFWKRWSSEYLRELQQKKKWINPSKTFSVGDIVLIRDDNLPPLKWKCGRITKLKPGIDGIVRVVELKTQFNTTERAVTRICPLFSEESFLLNEGSFKVGEHVEP